MQQDIRLTRRNKIKPTHILLSTGSTLFCANIINKYAFETKLSKYILLEYLLQKKSSSIVNKSIKNIFSSIDFHIKQTQKLFRNYPLAQQLLQQKYTGTENKKDHIFHNQKLIQKKTTKKESQELQINKEDHIIYIDKKMTITFSAKDLVFHNQKSIQKNMIKKEYPKLLTDRNQNIIIDHQMKVTPLQRRKTDKNRSSKKTNIVYAVDNNGVSQQEVSSHIGEKKVIEINNSDQSITVEKTVKNINHYEIKKIAEKVYPLIIKQWQKDLERRGVFYG